MYVDRSGLSLRNLAGVRQELRENCKNFLDQDPSNSLVTNNGRILDAIRYIRGQVDSKSRDFESLSGHLEKQTKSFNPLTWFQPTWSSILRDEKILGSQECSNKLRKIFDYQILNEAPFESVLSKESQLSLAPTSANSDFHSDVIPMPVNLSLTLAEKVDQLDPISFIQAAFSAAVKGISSFDLLAINNLFQYSLPYSITDSTSVHAFSQKNSESNLLSAFRNHTTPLLNSTLESNVFIQNTTSKTDLPVNAADEATEAASSIFKSVSEGLTAKNLIVVGLALATLAAISFAVYRTRVQANKETLEKNESSKSFNSYWSSINQVESKRSSVKVAYYKVRT